MLAHPGASIGEYPLGYAGLKTSQINTFLKINEIDELKNLKE